MSKVTEALATLGIHNEFNFAKAGGAKILVTYYPQETGRGYRSAKYVVAGIELETDPNTAWYNYGQKTFNVFERKDKHKQRDAALKWAAKTFHIKEWAKMPYRESWVEKSAYDRVMAMLKERGL